MIITQFVKLKINLKNIDNLIECGYSDLILGQELEIRSEHLSVGSHNHVMVECDICGKVKDLMYREYLRNIKSGGYYSCKGKCSSDKNRLTNLKKYGVDNPSKSLEIKNKKVETSLKNYGVDYYSKTDEFKDNFKAECLLKFGVDNPSKSKEIKERRKTTMNQKFGVDYYVLHDEFKSKSKETSIRNWGVDHKMKIRDEVKRRLNKKGLDFETNEFKIYRSKVDNLTKKNKNMLIENWDGFDYYDGEHILNNFNLPYQHGDYPTIDHKISVYYGFVNGLSMEDISDFSNLCFTKRRINSKKNNKVDFIL